MTESKKDPSSDQISPFAKKVNDKDHPSAAYDKEALNSPTSSSPFKFGVQNLNLDKAFISRSQTKKPRKNIGPYQISKTLGSGSMGKVKLAIHNETGEKYAVKIIPRKAPIHKGAPKDESRDIRIHREIALMVLVNHPYIVSLKEAMIMPQHYYLFFEYVSGGQILDYIISHGKLKEKNARRFARQMLSAIDYCHRHSVVHRDLKIENILITEDGNIKIIDFGLSNLFSTKSQLNTFCGSLYFAAPELLSAQEYTGPEVDVWSLGIVFYVLVCGRVPFDDPNMPALHAKIKKGDVSYPTFLSRECKHLLSRMLCTNPSQRATISEILKHPWVTKGFENPIENYLPQRKPIELPLDMNVIQRMKGFEFGNEEKIKADLEEILSSEQPVEITTSKVKEMKKVPFFHKNKSVVETTTVYNHPLVSIYYLVKEKLERETKPNTSQSFNIVEEEANDANGPDLASSIIHSFRPKNSHSNQPDIVIAEPDSPFKDTSERQGLTSQKSKEQGENEKTPNVLKRLSSAMKTSKTTNFHRLSHGPTNDISMPNSPKPGVGSRIGRRISRLITRHLSMQEPKMRNSFNEFDNLVATNDVQNNLHPSPSSPHGDHDITSQDSHAGLVIDKNSEEGVRPHLNQMKPRSATLKGLFSVSTTSTKKAKIISDDILSALKKLGIKWKEIDGYFECQYCPDMMSLEGVGEISHSEESTECLENGELLRSTSVSKSGSPQLSAQEFIREESLEIKELNGTSTSRPDSKESSPKNSPDSINSTRILSARHETVAKLSNPNRGYSNEPTSNRVVKFQIHLVRIKVLLRLHGIQFRRLEGPSWEYKAICSKILNELKL
ncbi:Pkinase-domain-containing protein [Neoconidiobolus thromboides FSU 785]|nr:Pkinase-domain-containing protein [Neoconidiobolus thromboides FSU 785]